MAQQSTATSSTASAKRPSMGTQLSTVLSLYQSLATLLFTLLEQRASIRGRDAAASSASGSSASSYAALQTHSLLDALPISFQAELAHLSLFRRRVSSTAGPSSSMSSQGIDAEAEVEPDDIIEALRVVDALLARLVGVARRHAANQARIEQLVAECREADGALRTRIRRLAKIKAQCERIVSVGAEEVDVMDRAEKKPLDYKDVLAYAGRLSQTTTAPAGFKLPTHKDDEENEEEEEEVDVGEDEKGEQKAVTIKGDEEGVAAGEQKENKKRKKKKPIYATEDVDGAQAAQFRGQDLVPPELLDKLPFPSVSAMRKGVVEMPFPTWEVFRQTQLDEENGGIGEQGPLAGASIQIDQQEQRQAQAEAQRQISQQKTAAPVQQRKPPVEDDDDGFGLDLS